MGSSPFRVYEYEDADGRSDVRAWRLRLRRSNPRASAKAEWLIALLADKGTSLRFPYVSHVEGPIFELRGRGRVAVRLYDWQQEHDVFIIAAGEVKQRQKASRQLVAHALAAYTEWNEERRDA